MFTFINTIITVFIIECHCRLHHLILKVSNVMLERILLLKERIGPVMDIIPVINALSYDLLSKSLFG